MAVTALLKSQLACGKLLIAEEPISPPSKMRSLMNSLDPPSKSSPWCCVLWAVDIEDNVLKTCSLCGRPVYASCRFSGQDLCHIYNEITYLTEERVGNSVAALLWTGTDGHPSPTAPKSFTFLKTA